MSAAEIRQRIRELRERLAQASAASWPKPENPSAEDTAGYAEAADGQVRVEAAGGRLTAVRLDGRVMRMSARELGELLTETCNRALERTAAATTSAQEAPPVDFSALAEQLQQVHGEGLRQMARMMQGLHEAAQVIRQRAVVPGDIGGTSALEHLLEDTVRGVEAFRRSTERTDETAEAEQSVGHGLNDLIRVTAESARRLGEIAIDEQAMRRSSHEIAEETVRAANQALEAAREASSGPMRQAKADLEATAARLQEASIEQLGALTDSLKRFMHGIDRP
ncbi:hypothetical protein [Thermomonospora catenispora]|uniref:hypothetical protein n=1 Tax=Thermomonospora catenispora TaxID=2493090 RepID=UPI0011212886|nr:hypothetical protein [Thermomonospora catenispora]TNY38217.1 hypothetical protein EIO00_04190 [Thermomonospora catenispora]